MLSSGAGALLRASCRKEVGREIASERNLSVVANHT